MRPALSEAIAAGPLLLDGAMGSLLYERGVLHTRSYDELNLSQPELILGVHRDYVQAGAELIETNTFGANRIALARHGLADKAQEINFSERSFSVSPILACCTDSLSIWIDSSIALRSTG